MASSRVRPIVLAANMPETFYRGAGRIGSFRSALLPERPDDWIASVTPRFGGGTSGMTRLDDGVLADVIAADPVAWLGAGHVAQYGPDPALLVKLLDAGQRLPLHVHPDRGFAAKHLASPYGKTEAWIVLEARPDAVVHLGFSRDVPALELAGWVDRQDVSSLLAVTNRVPVAAGDTVLCPAGTPHSIGDGILVVELQEPSDWSILLEWRDFALGPDDALLGLPLDEALACVDRAACPPARLSSLRGRRLNQAFGSLLPDAADPFFVAERVGAGAVLPAGYSVLIVYGGVGALRAESGPDVPLRRGSTVVVPHAAGPCTLTGDLQAVRCCPAR